MNTASQSLVGMANSCRHGRTLGLRTHHLLAAWLLAASAGLGLAISAQAQTAAQKTTVIKGATAVSASVPSGSSSGFAALGPTLELIIGKSTLMRTPSPIERISVGNPSIADVSLINPSELYLLGKAYGSTNLVIWRKGAETTVIDVNVSIDADRMEKKLRDLLPDETGIRVRPAADSRPSAQTTAGRAARSTPPASTSACEALSNGPSMAAACATAASVPQRIGFSGTGSAA